MPTEDEIKPEVLAAFAKKLHTTSSGLSARVNNQTDALFDDLGMGPDAIDSMTGPLSKISTGYEGGLQVPKSAIRQEDTLTGCIELTTKRANGEK